MYKRLFGPRKKIGPPAQQPQMLSSQVHLLKDLICGTVL
jgi:hypothetical protein